MKRALPVLVLLACLAVNAPAGAQDAAAYTPATGDPAVDRHLADINEYAARYPDVVKPLFETESAEARRTGTLTEDAYAPLLLTLIDTLNRQPETAVRQVTHSHVTGNHGTREFFLHVGFGGMPALALHAAVGAAVAAAAALAPYRKER